MRRVLCSAFFRLTIDMCRNGAVTVEVAFWWLVMTSWLKTLEPSEDIEWFDIASIVQIFVAVVWRLLICSIVLFTFNSGSFYCAALDLPLTIPLSWTRAKGTTWCSYWGQHNRCGCTFFLPVPAFNLCLLSRTRFSVGFSQSSHMS